MPAIRQLDLIVPGLAGPVSDPPVTDYLRTRPRALDRLLSRSHCIDTGVSEPDAVLLDYFGVGTDAGLPVAGLTGLADFGVPDRHCLLRADPVHLRADQSCLRLFEANSFELSREEAGELVASINEFNREYGWQLEAPVPQRWYLRLPEVPALSTTSPFRAAGRNIDPCLPAGPDARHWRMIMNELQMFLHEHPVNRARQQRGQPAVNSLWFWGGGVPRLLRRFSPGAVYASDPLAVGLSSHAGVNRHELPAGARAVLDRAGSEHALVVIDSLLWPAVYGDMEPWLEAMQALERFWFGPLLDALTRGELRSLTIDACGGRRFRTGRWRQRAFWQPQRHFERRLPQ